MSQLTSWSALSSCIILVLSFLGCSVSVDKTDSTIAPRVKSEAQLNQAGCRFEVVEEKEKLLCDSTQDEQVLEERRKALQTYLDEVDSILDQKNINITYRVRLINRRLDASLRLNSYTSFSIEEPILEVPDSVKAKSSLSDSELQSNVLVSYNSAKSEEPIVVRTQAKFNLELSAEIGLNLKKWIAFQGGEQVENLFDIDTQNGNYCVIRTILEPTGDNVLVKENFILLSELSEALVVTKTSGTYTIQLTGLVISVFDKPEEGRYGMTCIYTEQDDRELTLADIKEVFGDHIDFYKE